MSINIFESRGSHLVQRPRIFVSYHHRNDQQFYNQFSAAFHDTYEVIYDNSLERQIDSDNTEYVMRRIRENHIHGTSCTAVLVGAETPGRKYVDWEIKATLEKGHGLIGVRLPTARTSDGKTIVPARLQDNIVSGFALWVSWSDIISSAARLGELVRESRSRQAQLIDNSRERMQRNQ